MPLIPLLPLFHSFNKEYFDGSLTHGLNPLVSVRWSDGRLRKTAGFYKRSQTKVAGKKPAIVLSRPVLQYLPQSATESTLCHEMIHAWTDLVLGLEEGHGPQFHSMMNKINSSQNAFQITVRHTFPVPQTPQKWWAICPSCSVRYPYRRIVKNAACKSCCQIHHHGKWNRSCLFSYEPFLEGV